MLSTQYSVLSTQYSVLGTQFSAFGFRLLCFTSFQALNVSADNSLDSIVRTRMYVFLVRLSVARTCFSVPGAAWDTVSRAGNGPGVDDLLRGQVKRRPQRNRAPWSLQCVPTTFQRLTRRRNDLHQDATTCEDEGGIRSPGRIRPGAAHSGIKNPEPGNRIVTENREQRTENREQRTENREQRTENRELRTEY